MQKMRNYVTENYTRKLPSCAMSIGIHIAAFKGTERYSCNSFLELVV